MKKLKLEEVEQVLIDSQISEQKICEIKNKLVEIANPQEEEEDDVPKEKKQYVVLTKGDNVGDTLGWVFQVSESENPGVVNESLIKVANDFNITKKGRKCPVKNVGELIEAVPSKFFKAYNIQVKTKFPVLVQKITEEKITA